MATLYRCVRPAGGECEARSMSVSSEAPVEEAPAVDAGESGASMAIMADGVDCVSWVGLGCDGEC
jgi:hypothetical protein